MGRYFVWLGKGNVRDISFRKKVPLGDGTNLYHVYLGKLCAGQVSPGTIRGWNVISYRDHDLDPMRTDPGAFGRIARSEGWNGFDPTSEVSGFSTRLDAAFYLASHWKLRPERCNDEDQH